jgi:hypothetical protein
MAKYQVYAEGAARTFEITGGLQEGYGPTGRIHLIEEVQQAYAAWAATRSLSTGTLAGLITPAQVVYSWPDATGQFTNEGKEEGFTLAGWTNVEFDGAIPDEAVWERLVDLASARGSALGQARMHVRLKDRAAILQAERTVTPTGETV